MRAAGIVCAEVGIPGGCASDDYAKKQDRGCAWCGLGGGEEAAGRGEERR